MKAIVYILIMCFLFSCSGDQIYVRFKTAQPDGVKASKSFKRKFKGSYVNCSDPNDKLIISDHLVLGSKTLQFISHINDLELDTTFSVNRNKKQELKILFENEGYKFEIYADTINASKIELDTIFQISENQVLKNIKGSYFLNFKKGEAFWNVSKLNLKKDTLLIGEIFPSDTLLRYDFVSKYEMYNERDSTKITEYSIHSNKKDLKKLMKSNAFEECKCYYKVN